MLVGVLTADLLFPDAASLKDKRRRLSGLLGRIRAGFPVSAAEVGDHELWQRGQIAVAVVSTDARLVRSMMDRIADLVGRDGEIELLERRVEILTLDERLR